MKKFINLFVVILLGMFLFSCKGDYTDSDVKQADATRVLMDEAQNQIGLPNITNFQQKKNYKMILEECDRTNLICYAYLQSKLTGKLIFIGKCLGYGVPFSAQYTNPERVVEGDHMLGYDLTGINYVMTMPQPDPNGLFMPTSSSATWLMLLDKKGVPHPVYIEPEILVSPFPLDDAILG